MRILNGFAIKPAYRILAQEIEIAVQSDSDASAKQGYREIDEAFELLAG